MNGTTHSAHETLGYATRSPDAVVPRHYPLVAALFTVPAIAAGVALVNLIARTPPLGAGAASLAGWLWLAAIISAIGSCFYFAQRFKPWYVWLCLIFNFSGLAFTLLPPGGIWFLHLVQAAFRGGGEAFPLW
jgi:hypothetical protein